jgi:hypothetical protein
MNAYVHLHVSSSNQVDGFIQYGTVRSTMKIIEQTTNEMLTKVMVFSSYVSQTAFNAFHIKLLLSYFPSNVTMFVRP